MPFTTRKRKCKLESGESGTHIIYKKKGKKLVRVGCTSDPEGAVKARYAAERQMTKEQLMETIKNMIHEEKITIELENIADADLIVCTEPFNPSRDQLSDYESMLKAGINKELTLLCANPDFVVDVGETREMCAGSVASMYEQMGGKVIYFGKPHNKIYQEVYSFLNKVGKARSESILCIGDGLNTDIKGANKEKLDSLLVVGGLLKTQHLTLKGNNTIIDVKKLNQTIEKNEVHVDYAIKFFR